MHARSDSARRVAEVAGAFLKLGLTSFGGPIAHPTLLGNQALLMRHNKYIVPAGLHAKMQFEFVEPLRVGRSAARESRPVRPVPDEHVNATILGHAYYRFVDQVGYDVAGDVLTYVPFALPPSPSFISTIS